MAPRSSTSRRPSASGEASTAACDTRGSDRSARSLADFDWKHPKKIPRPLFEELLELRFLADATNIVFVGPNGVGKTMLAQNLAHQAVLRGHKVRFTEASTMLGDLAAQDGPIALRRRLHRYTKPELLVIDEIGYLSYNDCSADLLFEVVNRRYQKVSTTPSATGAASFLAPHASSPLSIASAIAPRSSRSKASLPPQGVQGTRLPPRPRRGCAPAFLVGKIRRQNPSANLVGEFRRILTGANTG